MCARSLLILVLLGPVHATAKRVAIQLSGHLRKTCDSDAALDRLRETVRACRNSNAVCDVFLQTWDRLEAATSAWHTPAVPHGSPSSQTCAGRLAKELAVAAVAVEQEPLLPFALQGNETWWTRARGESHISLAGIASGIAAQRRVNDMRRAYEAQHGAYGVVLRMRPDVYRADHLDNISWALLSAPGSANHVYSCRAFRWPGYKGGDMCYFALSSDALNRLYEAWEAYAASALSAMACAWRVRSRGCAPVGKCSAEVHGCNHLGQVDGAEFPENLMSAALSRANLRGLSFSVLATGVGAALWQQTHECLPSTPSSRPRTCVSRKYTPCPIIGITQPQCEAQCVAAAAHGCRKAQYEAGPHQRCYLLPATSRSAAAQRQVSGGAQYIRASACQRRSAERKAHRGAGTWRRKHVAFGPGGQQATRRLPILAVEGAQSAKYDGVRNGWSGWWLRLKSACDALPPGEACTLWSVEPALLPAPRCPVNCNLVTRPTSGDQRTADALLLSAATSQSADSTNWPRTVYCFESEAGKWRHRLCSSTTRAVSTRRDAHLRFSWFSRYYLPVPFSQDSAASLLAPHSLKSAQFQLETRKRSKSVALLSVWFRHCHTDAKSNMTNRQKILSRLKAAGLPYASYGRCMRNVPTTDPVLDTSQGHWLENKQIGMRRHPFVLVSENSAQPGWVTEKMYQALAAGVVPVWFGTPRGWAEQFLFPLVPPGSVVDASRWPSLQALAQFLRNIAQNASAYEHFHRWRHEPDLVKESVEVLRRELAIAFEATPCRICQELHSAGKPWPTL